ncbi:lipoprotein-releasing ABC transporter permease subunit [Shewanella sp. NIFS-20-20]|uniref:lipoprotein-releasing ABC transporter permease subunit n=1 Tax=Shewanella sp. NIFS-20-20 TaxID=2853806 RepID=UPI001C47960D|nr:lipoprotein-releasing ABC transporter permease subunit [Shewanella sp. NIFS-20-20]MBV7315519.1 lipoprotein-releasing ABC transporter permease subunit [Shewanella sp. NIFS-20-20]
MNLRLPCMIGWRYWRAKKANSFASFITFFAVMGIFLGVAALIIVGSVMNGLEGQLKHRILGAVPQLVITAAPDHTLPTTLAAELSRLPDVIAVTPSASTQAMIQAVDGIRAIQVYGIEPQQAALTGAGDTRVLSTLAAGDYRIVLGSVLANQLGVRPGEQVRVISGDGVVYSPLGPVPSQRKFTVAGVFEMGSQVDAHVAYINYQDARRLMRLPSEGISSYRMYLSDPFEAAHLVGGVKQLLAADKITAKVSDWRQDYGHLFAAVKMEKTMMSLMLSLVVAVAAFNIVSALVIMVVDKTADIAVLKTQGLSHVQAMAVFIVQGSLNALVGLVLGVSGGVILTLYLNDIMTMLGLSILGPGTQLPVILSIWQLVVIIVGTLLITLFATLYPAVRAAKVEPAKVLRHE